MSEYILHLPDQIYIMMKKFFTAAALFFSLIATAQPELPEPTTLAEMHIRGNVKSVTEYEYEANSES